MDTTSIEQRVVLPGTPDQIYAAYTNADEHAAFTGADATGEPRVGSAMTAWDGYIEGTYLELEPGKRIVQDWITSEWPEGAAPSKLELTLEPVDEGTEIHLLQTGVPADQAADYDQGWHDNYWIPMSEYLEGK